MEQTLAKLCPELTKQQLEQFAAYYSMLVDWNTRMNLTAITEKDQVAAKHFADSLSAKDLLPMGAALADVGTGPGFPGIPLLIVRPDLQLTLMDGLNKRITFLQAVLEALGLTAQCVHIRAEDAGQIPLYRERFDVTTTRAVAALPTLIELTIPLLKVGGKSIAYKADPKEELLASKSALHLLHAKAEVVDVPADYGKRSLVVLSKTAPTPKIYPRRAGLPEKKPL